MKKLILIIFTIHCSLITIHCLSQPCLPEGITFTTQTEIDNFQTNYPNCTEIEGDVTIGEWAGTDITNLYGLSVLTSIGGDLVISFNAMMATLTGLDNLSSIGESLFITMNDTLSSLTGLEGLTKIDGVFHVEGNSRLIDFTGLDNVTAIGSSFYVDLNGQLVDFHGLENLVSVGGDFLIGGINIAFWIGNPSLANLSGLENLKTVGGGLTIAGNNSLSNLIALDNLNYIGENLLVFLNPTLAECNVQSICEYLANPNSIIDIHSNAPGCNSPEEVEEACESSCLPEGIEFTNQEQVDNFQINYPGCTEIEGGVEIGGWYNNISNLDSLSILTSIGGGLKLLACDSLISLHGLDNLTSVGGDLEIIHVDSITSLSGLESLTSIGGNLRIYYNDDLEDLSGIENIQAGSINNLDIFINPSLTTCHVQSICNYLVDPNGIVNIHENAPGCNNPPEITAACGFTLSCLPFGNYYFTSQEEIDDFQSAYSNCTELNGAIFIEGSGWFGSTNITSLTGLNAVVSINGDLIIDKNDSLISLAGLENLTTIQGNLSIGDLESGHSGNASLSDMNGLNNLAFIGEDFAITNNIILTSLSGLNSLNSIGGILTIKWNGLTGLGGLNDVLSTGGLSILGNQFLTSLEGLDGLNSVEGDIEISNNGILTNIVALENLSSIDGNLIIGGEYELGTLGNPSLVSLEGLENIEPNSIINLEISYNSSLSECQVQSICDHLVSPIGEIVIHNNAPGCSSPEEVEEACESSCLPEGIEFTSQEEIDNFKLNYPNCTEIEGYVRMGTWLGSDITNLNGLNAITAIDGGLSVGWWFMGNSLLQNLSGLENLVHIGGSLNIHANSVLQDLTGLGSLTSIGGDIIIGNGDAKSTDFGVKMNGNPYLKNVAGLENLVSVEGKLETHFNDSLNSFKGLEKLDSIGGIITSDPIASLSELSNLSYVGSDGLELYYTALSSLTGLENVSLIDGDFILDCNDSLTSLAGLENLASINGWMVIGGWTHRSHGNSQLISLTELSNLASIGGKLIIDRNASLMKLTGLENLTSIEGGTIEIGSEPDNWGYGGNPSLLSLEGLDNIDANTITELVIIYNTSLNTCDIESICDYLTSSNGTIEIHDNAPGCNSPEEVEEACNASVNELPNIYNFSIHPNPFSNFITVEFELKQPKMVTITIYNHLGVQVEVMMKKKSVGKQKIDWDAERLPAGIYFCVLQTNEGIQTTKMIKI